MTAYEGPNGRSVTAAPPTTSRRSQTSVRRPFLARYAPATRPLCPPPTTTTSQSAAIAIKRDYVNATLHDVMPPGRRLGPRPPQGTRRRQGTRGVRAPAH